MNTRSLIPTFWDDSYSRLVTWHKAKFTFLEWLKMCLWSSVLIRCIQTGKEHYTSKRDTVRLVILQMVFLFAIPHEITCHRAGYTLIRFLNSDPKDHAYVSVHWVWGLDRHVSRYKTCNDLVKQISGKYPGFHSYEITDIFLKMVPMRPMAKFPYRERF